MHKSYDPVKKECKKCGCLLPDRAQDIKNHSCNPYTLEIKLKKQYPDSPVSPKFKLGTPVSAEIMGEVKKIFINKQGKVEYLINGAWFKESQVYPLPEEEKNEQMS